jgi:DNA adenine methylase
MHSRSAQLSEIDTLPREGNREENREVLGTGECRARTRPFMKWAGGKRQLLPELLKRTPRNFTRYVEPFVGGGALFFALQPSCAYLSDINDELINVYRMVRDHPEDLISELATYHYEKEFFYKVRDLDRQSNFAEMPALQRAARTIYLNRTCFNGLYRVNASGYFNTPFGRYQDPTIVDPDNMRLCSELLQNATIEAATFDTLETKVMPEDFIYFDPPYVPLSETSSFTTYAKGGFGNEMQQALAELCVRLNQRGIRFMLSNSDTALVRDLYTDFKIEEVSASRSINSQAQKRGALIELLVTNY